MEWVFGNRPAVGAREQGIAAILVAVFLLSLGDSLVKLSGDRFGLAQLILVRSAVAGFFLATWLLAAHGRSALALVKTGWVWARSLCLAAMWLSYYAALPSMSFALAAACYYTSPVWMALMARFLLGASIGGAGWTAIGLSLAGVVVAVAPSPETLTPVLLLPLAAAGFYALSGIITWSRCREETAGAMAFTLNLCLCAVAALGIVGLAIAGPAAGEGFVVAVWPALDATDWGLAIVLGGLLAIIATAVAFAYRRAPTPVVGVFDTAYLPFAALWGALLFAEMPTPREALGIAMIAAGGIIMSCLSRHR